MKTRLSLHCCKSLNVFLWLVPAVALVLGGCGSGQASGNPPPLFQAISGTIVDFSSSQPIAGASVFLEQPDSSGVDRPVAKTTTGADGTFRFGGLASGNYDIVANASFATGAGPTSTYANTITLSVPAGTNTGKIPLVPEFGVGIPTGLPVTIMGLVSSTGGSGAAAVDASLTALQGSLSFSPQGKFTIPVFAGSTEKVTTATGTAGCASSQACSPYQLVVPESMPVMGTFSSAGTKYTIPPQDPVEVLYVIQGTAFMPSTSTPDCAPSTQTASPIVPLGTLISANPSIGFTACE